MLSMHFSCSLSNFYSTHQTRYHSTLLTLSTSSILTLLCWALLAQESAVPRFSADSNRSASETVLLFGSSEKTFMTHHDARPPRAVADSRQDPRPNYRKAGSVRRSFPDRPASSTPRCNDDDHIHEIERLQQQMQSLVAQLANERASKNSPTTRSAWLLTTQWRNILFCLRTVTPPPCSLTMMTNTHPTTTSTSDPSRVRRGGMHYSIKTQDPLRAPVGCVPGV